MNQDYILNVCLPSRDRLYMTQKTINSIWENSTIFKDINIYVFDNLTTLSAKRLLTFSTLLKDGKIKHYSYDTSTSLNECFPKTVIFRRWIDMMTFNYKFNKEMGINQGLNNLFLLTDNDMLYGPGWDEHFATAMEFTKKYNPESHFLVKYPGGVISKEREKTEFIKIKNKYNQSEELEVGSACWGGGSGCWVMDIDMLSKVRWNTNDFKKVYKKFKGHDSGTWTKIINENRIKNNNKKIKYVTMVKPSDMNEKPLVLHLGGVVGSMCNTLRENTYDDRKEEFVERDIDLKDKSVAEIYKENKHRGAW